MLAVLSLIVGANAQAERAKVWHAAASIAVAGDGVQVLDSRTVSFSSDAKRRCDTDDYPSYTRSGIKTVNWDAYEACQTGADLAFELSSAQTLTYLSYFVQEIGVPEAFLDRLSHLRGLDGTQSQEYADTRVGPVLTTFSYDGGNGLYVRVERVGVAVDPNYVRPTAARTSSGTASASSPSPSTPPASQEATGLTDLPEGSWIAVLESIPSDSPLDEALAKAADLKNNDRHPIVLSSTRHLGLNSGYWVVADGPHDSEAAARAACSNYGRPVGGSCYARST